MLALVVVQACPPYYPHKQISTIVTHPKSKHDILPIPPTGWPGRFHLQSQQVWGLEAWPILADLHGPWIGHDLPIYGFFRFTIGKAQMVRSGFGFWSTVSAVGAVWHGYLFG